MTLLTNSSLQNQQFSECPIQVKGTIKFCLHIVHDRKIFKLSLWDCVKRGSPVLCRLLVYAGSGSREIWLITSRTGLCNGQNEACMF